jgi:hypothetical protein
MCNYMVTIYCAEQDCGLLLRAIYCSSQLNPLDVSLNHVSNAFNNIILILGLRVKIQPGSFRIRSINASSRKPKCFINFVNTVMNLEVP